MAAVCAHLRGKADVVVILPDAPPIVRAWSLRVAPGLRVLCDHRPRGAVAGQFGFPSDGDALGLSVVVAEGRVVARTLLAATMAAPTEAAPAEAPASLQPAGAVESPVRAAPPAPTLADAPAAAPAPIAAASWWPGLLATAAWVLVAFALAQTAAPGTAP